jgi:hypothetical protein
MEAWFMTTDLQLLYEKYVDYITRLQKDYIDHVGPGVSDRYGPRLLCFEDFCKIWQRWGESETLQETWRCRFEAGYDKVADALLKRLEQALHPSNHHANKPLIGKAA